MRGEEILRALLHLGLLIQGIQRIEGEVVLPKREAPAEAIPHFIELAVDDANGILQLLSAQLLRAKVTHSKGICSFLARREWLSTKQVLGLEILGVAWTK